MECAARGRGSPCARGPPSRRCGLCGAVAYCSQAHQISHWNDHKEECPRLAEQMKNAEVLNDFPFTFLGAGKQETRCSILTSMGLHHIGIWKSECSCRPSVASSKSSWDGEVITFCDYLHCTEEGCCCKDSSSDSTSVVPDCRSWAVTVKVHKGFYHDVYEDIVKDSYPHLVVAPNAGIAAYSSWLPTIELLKEKGTPAIFTDYCEEAAHLAAHCIGTVTGQPLRVPVQLNPFRKPLVVEDSALCLPCHSNCFMFGM